MPGRWRRQPGKDGSLLNKQQQQPSASGASPQRTAAISRCHLTQPISFDLNQVPPPKHTHTHTHTHHHHHLHPTYLPIPSPPRPDPTLPHPTPAYSAHPNPSPPHPTSTHPPNHPTLHPTPHYLTAHYLPRAHPSLPLPHHPTSAPPPTASSLLSPTPPLLSPTLPLLSLATTSHAYSLSADRQLIHRIAFADFGQKPKQVRSPDCGSGFGLGRDGTRSGGGCCSIK